MSGGFLGAYDRVGFLSSELTCKLIDTRTEATAYCEWIVQTGGCVGLDCKGRDLGRDGSLELVAIFVCNTQGNWSLVFDVQKLGPPGSFGLEDVLAAPNVEKCVFDCRNDADALHGYEWTNVVDTSVVEVCARLMLARETTRLRGIVTAFADFCGENMSFRFNVEGTPFSLSCSLIEFKDWMQPHMKADDPRTIWTSRPLSPEAIAYAGVNAVMSYAIWQSAQSTWRRCGLLEIWLPRVKRGTDYFLYFYSVYGEVKGQRGAELPDGLLQCIDSYLESY